MKVAGPLETAHHAGTPHRDVKPANVLLSDWGEPQLTDFRITRIARCQLDVPVALNNFRRAFQIAKGVGPHSHAAPLAGALLGELLDERGELAEATRLPEESYLLGSAVGGVDYLAARYVIGARVKAAQGDQVAATTT